MWPFSLDGTASGPLVPRPGRARPDATSRRRRALATGVVACALGVAALGADRTGLESTDTRLTAGDAAPAQRFGAAVALSGDTAVIGTEASGSPDDAPNRVYILARTDGVWTEQAQLQPGPTGSSPGFGAALAVDGDTALVLAAPDSVQVHVRSGAAWSLQGQLVPSGSSGVYGSTYLSLSGDTAVVSSYPDVTVFTRSGGQWTEQATLDLVSPPTGPVAVDGDTLAVPDQDGHVRVFERVAGTWTEEADLVPTPDSGGIVGSVSLSGDTLLSDSDYRGPFVFTRAAGTWTQEAQLVPSYSSVSGATLSGDTVVVTETLSRQLEGKTLYGVVAVVYMRTEAGWSKQDEIALDEALHNGHNLRLALSGDTFLVGMGEADPDTAGAVHAVVFSPAPREGGCACRLAPGALGGSSAPPLVLAAMLAFAIRRKRNRP